MAEIQSREKVDAFDTAVDSVIEMPVDEFGLVGVGLFFDRIVEYENGIVGLNMADVRFDDFPLSTGLGWLTLDRPRSKKRVT